MIETCYQNDTLENAEAELTAARREEGRLRVSAQDQAAEIHRLQSLYKMHHDRMRTAHCHVVEAEARVRAAGGRP